jgi:hypothetical protein
MSKCKLVTIFGVSLTLVSVLTAVFPSTARPIRCNEWMRQRSGDLERCRILFPGEPAGNIFVKCELSPDVTVEGNVPGSTPLSLLRDLKLRILKVGSADSSVFSNLSISNGNLGLGSVVALAAKPICEDKWTRSCDRFNDKLLASMLSG